MSRRSWFHLLGALLINLLVAGNGVTAARWVTSWASMPQLTEPGNLPPAPFNSSTTIFPNTTIRQTVRLTLSGSPLRLRISNRFGTVPLQLTSAAIALPTNNSAGVSSITPGSSKQLTFSGDESFIIPEGAYVVSDPVDFDAKAEDILSISLFLERGAQAAGGITGHPGSRTTSWLGFGSQVESADLDAESRASTAHWYFISSLEVQPLAPSAALVLIGDSITDGRGSTTDGNDRWPDQLLTRVLHGSNNTTNTTSPLPLSILNLAAGGNRILADGLGPNVLARFDRDAISQPGAAYVLVFEGVNDIGTTPTSPISQQAIGNRIISAYKQLIARAHAFALPIFGAIITPFGAAPGNESVQAYSDPEREKTRSRVNDWIRDTIEEEGFDGLVDFDEAVRDQGNGTRLDLRYDSGDYLHLNPAGYRRMAEVFGLELFARFEGGVWG